MEPIKVQFKLQRIHAVDEGDGSGDAEPFLWTAFFKVDGESVTIDATSLKLSGSPALKLSPANSSHENLAMDYDEGLDAGEDAGIPASMGEYSTIFFPVDIPAALRPLAGKSRVSGLIGALAVLLEEDSTSDSDINEGHAEFNAALTSALQQAVASLGLTKQTVTDADMAQLQAQISARVTAKIKDAVGVGNWLGGFITLGNGQDELIGDARFTFDQSSLLPVALGTQGKALTAEWAPDEDGVGVWNLFGRVDAAVADFAGAFRGGVPERSLLLGETSDNLTALIAARAKTGWRPARIMDVRYGGQRRYHAILEKSSGPYTFHTHQTLAQLQAKNTTLTAAGQSLVHVEPWVTGSGDLRLTGVWWGGMPQARLLAPKSWTAFVDEWKQLSAAGWRLQTIRTFVRNGQRQWLGVLHAGGGAHYLYAGLTRSAFFAKADELHKSGCRPVSLVRYVAGGAERYACAWRGGSDAAYVVATHGQQAFEDNVAKYAKIGRWPVDLSMPSLTLE